MWKSKITEQEETEESGIAASKSFQMNTFIQFLTSFFEQPSST